MHYHTDVYRTQIQLAATDRNKKRSRGQTCRKSYSRRILHHLSCFHVHLLPHCCFCYGFTFWRVTSGSNRIRKLVMSQRGPIPQWSHDPQEGQAGGKVFTRNSRSGNTPIECKLLFSKSFQQKPLPHCFCSHTLWLAQKRSKSSQQAFLQAFLHLKQTKTARCVCVLIKSGIKQRFCLSLNPFTNSGAELLVKKHEPKHAQNHM